MITRPLLAGKITKESELDKLRYPLIASPKIDGIRLLIHPELGPVSRSFKPIPNRFLREWFSRQPPLRGCDGEIVVTEPTASNCFNATTSAVMCHDGSPTFYYLVFDIFEHAHLEYATRLKLADHQVRLWSQSDLNLDPNRLAILHDWTVVDSPATVLGYEEECLSRGFEGVMLRCPRSPYKSGRSTLKEGILVKLKRTEDDEATVIGFEPLKRNLNPQERDAFGLAKRSSHQGNKSPDALLGTLIVEHPTFGVFGVGSGFDIATRIQIWENQDRYRGQPITFKYQKVGVVSLPRFPIFKGFRHIDDTST